MAVIVPPSQAYPLPPWARAVFYLARTVAIANGLSQFDSAHEIQPQGLSEGSPDPTKWIKVVMSFEDLNSQDFADNQQMSIEVVNYTGDLVDNTWTTADYDQVISDIANNLIIPIKSYICSRYVLTSYKVYERMYADYEATSSDPAKPPPVFIDSGPPVYTIARNDAMTGITFVPPQCTSTVTEITPVRRNWGRNYMPTLAQTVYNQSGRVNTPTVDALALMWFNTYQNLAGHNFIPVVPATRVKGEPLRALQAVTGIRIDDVADVVRRRRHKYKTYSKTYPLAVTALPAER